MSTLAGLVVEISSLFDPKGFQDAETRVKDFGTQVNKTMKAAGQAFALVSAGAAIVGAAIGKTVFDFAESEKAAEKLASALRITNQYTNALSRDMLAFSSSMQSVTGVSDETVTELQALATTMGVTGDDVQRVVKLALDLNAAVGIDMATAIRFITKSADGAAQGFKRFGINLDEDRIKTQGMTYVLAELEKRVGGTAVAIGSTLAGQVNIAKEAIGDMSEEIGRYFAPAIASASSWVTEMVTQMAVWQRQMNGTSTATELEAQQADKAAKAWERYRATKAAIESGQFMLRSKVGVELGQQLKIAQDETAIYTAMTKKSATDVVSTEQDKVNALARYNDAVATRAEERKKIDETYSAWKIANVQNQNAIELQIELEAEAQRLALQQQMADSMTGAFSQMIYAGQVTGDAFGKLWNDIGEGFRVMLAQMIAQLIGKAAIFALLSFIPGMGGVLNFISALQNWNPLGGGGLPKTASGGMVLGPQVRSFAENGPEIALPLNDNRTTNALSTALAKAGNSTSSTRNITINVTSDVLRDRRTVRRLADAAGADIMRRLTAQGV